MSVAYGLDVMTNTRVTQVRSSNRRPSDHKDFLGDIKESETFAPDEFAKWLEDGWLNTYVRQGDRVIIERI